MRCVMLKHNLQVLQVHLLAAYFRFPGAGLESRLLRRGERIGMRLFADGFIAGVLAEGEQRFFLRPIRGVAAGQQQRHPNRPGGGQTSPAMSLPGVGVQHIHAHRFDGIKMLRGDLLGVANPSLDRCLAFFFGREPAKQALLVLIPWRNVAGLGSDDRGRLLRLWLFQPKRLAGLVQEVFGTRTDFIQSGRGFLRRACRIGLRLRFI
jgi:hypothetical protein